MGDGDADFTTIAVGATRWISRRRSSRAIVTPPVTGLIEAWAAGKALNLGAAGAARLVGLLRGEQDSLGRLLVLLDAEFGEECDLDRDVFFAWRKREDLVGMLDGALSGALRGSARDIQHVADVIEPRLVRTPGPVRRELAERMAAAVFGAVALVPLGAGRRLRSGENGDDAGVVCGRRSTMALASPVV